MSAVQGHVRSAMFRYSLPCREVKRRSHSSSQRRPSGGPATGIGMNKYYDRRALAMKWRPGICAAAAGVILLVHSLAPAVAKVAEPSAQRVSIPPPNVATTEPPVGAET